MVRVATVNCLHGLDVVGGAPTRPDAAALERMADRLDELDVDVVALQEVDRDLPRSSRLAQVAGLAELLGLHGWFAPALLGDPDRAWRSVPADDPGGPAYGVGLLSRYPAVADGVRRIRLPGGGAGSRRPRARATTNPGWDREPRVALRVDLATPAGTLRVVTAHLSYLPWRGLRQLRRAGAAAVTRGDGVPRVPTVLAGDLNLPPWAVRSALPGWRTSGGRPTYPVPAPRMQVDHVLLRGNVRALEVEVGPPLWSDHLPVVVTLGPDGVPPERAPGR